METNRWDAPLPAGWFPDPGGRHDYRYWNGAAWTDDVSDGGSVSVDPARPAQEPAAAASVEPPASGGPRRSVEDVLAAHRANLSGGRVYFRPDIPEKALAGATTNYADGVDPNEVLLLIDTTMRHNGKAGLLVTSTRLLAHDGLTNADVALDEMGEVKIEGNWLRIGGRNVHGTLGLGESAHPVAELLRDIAVATGSPGGSSGTTAAWGIEQAAAPAGPGKSGLAIEGPTRFHPGEEVTFTLRLDPWPDPKLTDIGVELCLLRTHLAVIFVDPSQRAGTPMGILMAQPAHWEAVEIGDKDSTPVVTQVANATIGPADVDSQGVVSGSLTLPEDCPPTLDGILTWQLRATVSRRRGLNHSGAIGIEVAAPTAEQLLAVGPPVAAGSEDWLVRAFHSEDQWNHCVAPPDRRREVDIVVHTPSVAPGGTVSGEVTVTVDPVRYYLETTRARSGRVQKKVEEAAQAMPRSLQVDRVTVSLECWRGSEERSACHRVCRVTEDIRGAGAIASGDEIRIPFALRVPTMTPQFMHTGAGPAGADEQPLLATFRGAQHPGLDLDDIRWRVVAQVIAPSSQFGNLAGHGAFSGSLGYSGDVKTSPLWAAAEVVVGSEP